MRGGSRRVTRPEQWERYPTAATIGIRGEVLCVSQGRTAIRHAVGEARIYHVEEAGDTSIFRWPNLYIRPCCTHTSRASAVTGWVTAAVGALSSSRHAADPNAM